MALILLCRFRSCRYSHYYRYSVTSSVVSHQNLHCGYRDNLNPSHRHHFNKQFTMWIYDNYINVWFLLSFVWIYRKRINTSAQKRLWWVRTLAVSSEVGGQGLRSEVEVGVGGQGGVRGRRFGGVWGSGMSCSSASNFCTCTVLYSFVFSLIIVPRHVVIFGSRSVLISSTSTGILLFVFDDLVFSIHPTCHLWDVCT